MSKEKDLKLERNEILEYKAKISGWLFFTPSVIALYFIIMGTLRPLTAGIMYFIALCFILYPCIIKLSTKLIITNKEIVGRTGFIYNKFLKIPFNHIKSVKISQGFLGNLLNYGKIIIIDSNNNKYKFKFVANPLAFKLFVSEKNIIKNSPYNE